MIFDDQLKLELIRAAIPLLTVLITLALGWFVGKRLTVHWNIRQKRRELRLSTANQFYQLYGEFFAVWKLWNYSKYKDIAHVFPKTTRCDFLKRASAAEAGVEAILVKLASERIFSKKDIDVLGSFRQAYQSLRECIRDDEQLDWPYQEYPEYLAFKNLAEYVACMLSSDGEIKLPTAEQAGEALRQITSAHYEEYIEDREGRVKRWVKIGTQLYEKSD